MLSKQYILNKKVDEHRKEIPPAKVGSVKRKVERK